MGKPKKGDVKYQNGKATVMAVDGNWLMARRPHCIPFTTDLKSWQRHWSDTPPVNGDGQ